MTGCARRRLHRSHKGRLSAMASMSSVGRESSDAMVLCSGGLEICDCFAVL